MPRTDVNMRAVSHRSHFTRNVAAIDRSPSRVGASGKLTRMSPSPAWARILAVLDARRLGGTGGDYLASRARLRMLRARRPVWPRGTIAAPLPPSRPRSRTGSPAEKIPTCSTAWPSSPRATASTGQRSAIEQPLDLHPRLGRRHRRAAHRLAQQRQLVHRRLVRVHQDGRGEPLSPRHLAAAARRSALLPGQQGRHPALPRRRRRSRLLRQ